MIPYTVIDKSYLQGAGRLDIHKLCKAGAIMSDTLFAELVTSTAEECRRCFGKFPIGPNPINMIPSVGFLMHYEIENRAPCTPLIDRQPYARFEFHAGLAAGTYDFGNKEIVQAVQDITRETGERVACFREASSVLESWFPELKRFPPNGPRPLIDAAMNSVASDRDRVREIYRAILRGMQALFDEGFSPPMPNFSSLNPAEIDESWIWFRTLQAQLLAALEFVRKNGVGSLGQQSESVEHDLLDAEYVALGTLSGALASRDKTLQRFFQLVCPQGILIS